MYVVAASAVLPRPPGSDRRFKRSSDVGRSVVFVVVSLVLPLSCHCPLKSPVRPSLRPSLLPTCGVWTAAASSLSSSDPSSAEQERRAEIHCAPCLPLKNVHNSSRLPPRLLVPPSGLRRFFAFRERTRTLWEMDLK